MNALEYQKPSVVSKEQMSHQEIPQDIEVTPACQDLLTHLDGVLTRLESTSSISEPAWNFLKKCMPIACALALTMGTQDVHAQQPSTYPYGTPNGGYVQNQQVNPQVVYGTIDQMFRMAGQISQTVEQTSTDPKTKQEAHTSKQVFQIFDKITRDAAQIDDRIRRQQTAPFPLF